MITTKLNVFRANRRTIAWDSNLASLAQAFANTCNLGSQSTLFDNAGVEYDQMSEFMVVRAEDPFDAEEFAKYFRFSIEYPNYPSGFQKWTTFSWPGAIVFDYRSYITMGCGQNYCTNDENSALSGYFLVCNFSPKL